MRPSFPGGALAALVLLAGLGPPAAVGDVTPDDTAAPVCAEHRYRLSAAIRPLLFWVGAGNVGGARIVWRADGSGRTGYELLLGSDPARAPRRINRWGWVREDASPSGATMLGVMNRSEDDSLDQARSELERGGKDGFRFKLIRARVEDGEARAESTTVFAPHDFDFRQLDELQRFVDSSRLPPRVRTGPLRADTRPGLLFALADLVGTGVAAARAKSGGGPPAAERMVPFTFNAGLYELRIASWERVPRASYGKRRYERLVRLELESRNLATRGTEHFTLVCGTDGALAEVPVFVRYQPKWWFKVEGVLDESEGL